MLRYKRNRIVGDYWENIMAYTILVIEDSPEYQLLVSRALSQHKLIVVDHPDMVMNALEANSIELIILDITLPSRDGFSVLQEIQSHALYEEIPVICLTGKDQISDKVTAFSLGADDYVQKPFNPIELKARVESRLIKRTRNLSKNLELGEVQIDFNSHRVTVDGGLKEVSLTQTEFKILSYMGKHPDQVFSREQLLVSIWGDDGAVFDRAVDVHVCSLRKKLAPYGVQFKSVAGVGYKIGLNARKCQKAS